MTSVDAMPFGTLTVPDRAGRRDVELIALRSSSLAVSILTLGAALHTVEAPDLGGRFDHVALHVPMLSELQDQGRGLYLGATCGRVAGRIGGAAFELDGVRYQLEPNDGPNQLHGGPDGFDRRVWNVVDVVTDHDGGRVVLALTSEDGDQGYPGTLEATASYELRGHVLRISYEATTDAPTMVNLTNHAYWNLGGTDHWARDRSIRDHELRLPGDRYLPTDDQTLPAGPLAAVDGTAFDLRHHRLLADVLSARPEGIDHAYEVPDPVLDLEADGLPLAAELHHPASGRTLTVTTDQPAIVVYTANHLALPFARQAAICLEAQQYPDAPNRPGLGNAVLRPGEHHRATTELTFGVR